MELAPAYVFLASNADSSYITSTMLQVMGGERSAADPAHVFLVRRRQAIRRVLPAIRTELPVRPTTRSAMV